MTFFFFFLSLFLILFFQQATGSPYELQSAKEKKKMLCLIESCML